MQSSSQLSLPRRRSIPPPLCVDTPVNDLTVVLSSSGPSSESESTLSSPSRIKPPSLRNMKRLSLALPFVSASTPMDPDKQIGPVSPVTAVRRRPSVASLPASTAISLLRPDEGQSPSIPYADGPIEILPKIWLGSEDNARDWRGLVNRGIKSVLNVAQEVACSFDSFAKPLRLTVSTPNLNEPSQDGQPKYYPGHVPSGRPGMHYLKLPWSHGQPDLVSTGLPAAFRFVDEALARGEGVLIHCQCGISRSGTLVIALVMRAAATCSPTVPADVWGLKGMQGAYTYVKSKSKHVGPNMSLIYELLDYERSLRDDDSSSPAPSDSSSLAAAEDEEWGRRRALLDESNTDTDFHGDSVEVAKEARALDKAMEDRIIARKPSTSSVSSTGIGMGAAWKSRYSGRKRAGSVASNFTSGSILSEDLVEEDEERHLLGVGGGFDQESVTTSPDSQCDDDVTSRIPPTPYPVQQSFYRPAPSAPPRLPPTPTQNTFDLTPRARVHSKNRHRPPPLSLLPPVPASPIVPLPVLSHPPRSRADSRKPDLPPPHLRKIRVISQPLSTPSQTLFVFPPSPTPTKAPSTMILTPNATSPVPFPNISTSSTFTHRQTRHRSLIGVPFPATPTTAFSRVDARGWIGN